MFRIIFQAIISYIFVYHLGDRVDFERKKYYWTKGSEIGYRDIKGNSKTFLFMFFCKMHSI